MRPFYTPILLCLALAATGPASAKPSPPDEKPAAAGEWGFRPANGATAAVNPPRFSWRPQRDAAAYAVEASRDSSFQSIGYRADKIDFNVHAPSRLFEPGEWFWRFKAIDIKGGSSDWSSARRFTIPADAHRFPLPPRDVLLSRVPSAHPRLFVRPEEMPTFRERAKGDLEPHATALVSAAEKALKSPTPIEEPPRYPEGTVSHSEEWRTLWWGARTNTMRTLEPAALLGFAYRLTGDQRFGNEAKRILLTVAKWDPKGATGYRYNDEAGMPYNYLFSRTYTFIHDLLSDAERAACRRIMTIRGREMYQHLCPSHFWSPYRSHQNRAWHFLGEIAVAFHGEIPEAGDWLWFSVNVFANVYPVWSDADGGWHEGMAYWSSYLSRFSWWADIMNAALDIDAYEALPFFRESGYLPLYAMPPGAPRGGFGDQVDKITSVNAASLTGILARQAQNPYWQWYAEAHQRGDDPAAGSDYVSFIRAARYPEVESKAPSDLPTARVFRGTGHAYLNTTLLDARNNVEVLFKSSPFGTQSHGYDSQNAFQIYAFGEPLLISSGTRDMYGSEHHSKWMWETRSTNNITVGGRGQIKHSARGIGRITAFHTSPEFDIVRGDAAAAYDPPLKRFTRTILFAKPGVIIIADELETDSAERFQYHLHSPFEIAHPSQAKIVIEAKNAHCQVALLEPADLALSYTDQFAAPLRPRVKLTQYHLTAETTTPAVKQRFLAVLRPHRPGTAPADMPAIDWRDDVLAVTCGERSFRYDGRADTLTASAPTASSRSR